MKIDVALLQRADIADGVEDNVVNLDSAKARKLLPRDADTYDGLSDGRVSLSAALGVSLPRPAPASKSDQALAYDIAVSARYFSHQPNMNMENCVATSALIMLKHEGVIRQGTSPAQFTQALARLGVKARELTAQPNLSRFNEIVDRLSADPNVGAGASVLHARLRDIDHDTMIDRLNAGRFVLAWTDYDDGTVGLHGRGHVVVLYRNPHNAKVMCLDPLFYERAKDKSVAFPVPLDGGSDVVSFDRDDGYFDTRIRIALNQRYVELAR